MRVMMLGLRAFPDVQGGVESHTENLCPILSSLGCDMEVVVRSAFASRDRAREWRGVRFIRVWAPKSKSLEAIIHSLLGVCVAIWRRPDVLHIQAIGPSIVTPIARLFGLNVVVTHHGPDYDREKWGRLAKAVLRFAEAMGMRFASSRIAISQVIGGIIKDKYGLDSELIPNGINCPPISSTDDALKKFGLMRGKYVLSVGRIVPEKRQIDLISAFAAAALPGWKLAIVGASDHPDAYSRSVTSLANSTPSVVATGFQSGRTLAELYAHAGIFVLPSSHEGLPIVLLEALSLGLPVIASAIPANLEVGLNSTNYYPVGNIEELKIRLQHFAQATPSAQDRETQREFIARRYNWHSVASCTYSVYLSVLAGRKMVEA